MNIQTSVITEERRPQNAKQRAREKKKWERLQAKINKLGGNKYTPGLFGWFLQQIGYKHTQQQIQAHQPAKSSKTQCSHGIFGIYVFSQKRAHITQRTNNFFWGVSISSEMGNWKANRTESEVSDRKTIHSGETWLRQGHKRGVKRFNIRAMKKSTRWFNSFKRYIIWGLKQFSCLRKSASICRSTVNAFGGAHKPYAHWNDKWLSLFHSLSLSFFLYKLTTDPRKISQTHFTELELRARRKKAEATTTASECVQCTNYDLEKVVGFYSLQGKNVITVIIHGSLLRFFLVVCSIHRSHCVLILVFSSRCDCKHELSVHFVCVSWFTSSVNKIHSEMLSEFSHFREISVSCVSSWN